MRHGGKANKGNDRRGSGDSQNCLVILRPERPSLTASLRGAESSPLTAITATPPHNIHTWSVLAYMARDGRPAAAALETRSSRTLRWTAVYTNMSEIWVTCLLFPTMSF